MVGAWRRAWDRVIPFLAFPPEVRRVIYTTNAIKSVNAQLRKIIDAHRQQTGRDIRLEVDGGIKTDNIRSVADAGADTFVAGSAIFGQPDYRAVIDAMRAQLAA